MKGFILILIALFSVNCTTIAQDKKTNQTKETEQVNTERSKYAVTRTDQEWKEQLTSLQYNILRKAGTESPFSSKLNKNYEDGIYICAGCDTELYRSENKFDSGTGWPSFDRSVKSNVELAVDYKIGYSRTELKCNTCGGHLGHSFNDGPRNTTGERHCINGAALKFKPIHLLQK